MSLRTSLRRLAGHDPEKPGLRERLATTAGRLAAARQKQEAPSASANEGVAPAPCGGLAGRIVDLWRDWSPFPETDGASWEALEARRSALLKEAAALPATRETLFPKALALAWIETDDVLKRGKARDDYATDGRLAWDLHAAIVSDTGPCPAIVPSEQNLLDRLDLRAATMTELQSLHDVVSMVADVAYATTWQGRCRMPHPRNGEQNQAGKLMQWLGDALTDVESAIDGEAKRRTPSKAHEREVRLELLASVAISGGDLDEMAALAQELTAHVERERRA